MTTIVASHFAHLLQSTCKQARIGRLPVTWFGRGPQPSTADLPLANFQRRCLMPLGTSMVHWHTVPQKSCPSKTPHFKHLRTPSYVNHINWTMKNHTYKQTTKKMQTINNKQLNIQHWACPCKSLLPSIGFQTVPNNREVWDQGVGNILVHRNASKRGRCMEMKEWTKKKQAFSVSVFSFNRFQRCRSRMWGLQTLNLMNLSPKRWSASLAVPVPVALRINVGSGRNPRSQDANNNVVMPNESL